MASNVTNFEKLVQQFSETAQTARVLSTKLGLKLEFLDLGGGFPGPFGTHGTTQYPENMCERITDILDLEFPDRLCDGMKIVFEAGRAAIRVSSRSMVVLM